MTKRTRRKPLKLAFLPLSERLASIKNINFLLSILAESEDPCER